MGMYSYIQGLKPKTEEYEKKLHIWKACEEIGISQPKELLSFFDGEICEDGIVAELPKEAIREYSDDSCREYFEVDLTKIPSDITKIRFLNSY